MKLATIQLSTQPLSNSKLDYYFKLCKKNGASIVVLGEYILNSFFKELEHMPLSLIKEQSNKKIKELKEFAKELDLIIIAPVVVIKKDKIYKTIMKATNKSVSYYNQQFLIHFKHWNEEKFFNNELSEVEAYTFNFDGYKFGIMFGYELHFDEVIMKMSAKKIDVLLVPSVSTFESNNRWQELCKVRAFCNNFYLLRANRIGESSFKKNKWKFYGDSLLIDPFGEIEENLGTGEEVMIVEIDKELIKEANKVLGFSKQGIK